MTDSAPATAKPSSKRAQNRAEHLAALLDAAEDVFAHKGYENASIADIAAAADLAVGTVYRFFPGKQDLGTAVMERIAASRVLSLRAVALPAAADKSGGLRTLVRLRVEHHVRHGAFLRMGFELQRSLGKREAPEHIRALFEETRALTVEFFETGAERGFWRKLPAKALARAFEGICNEEIFAWERDGRAGGAAALEDSVFASVSRLFLKEEPGEK